MIKENEVLKLIKQLIHFIFLSFIFLSFTIFIYSLLPSKYLNSNIKNTTGGYGASLMRSNDVISCGEVDVLFIGSSHCYRGFDTRIFNDFDISSFNLGSSSQTPLNSFYLLKEFGPKLKPQTIFLEVYWNTLCNNGVESSIDLISNSPLSYNLFEMAITTKSLLPTLTFYSQFIKRFSHPLNNESLQFSTIDKYIPGGYVETNRPIKQLDYPSIDPKIIGEFDQLKYVEKINTFCAESNIELVLIIAPVSPTITDSYINYQSKLEELKDFANINKLTFLDYNSKGKLSRMNLNEKKDWYDGSHLTQSGVVKFNNYLIQDKANLFIN